MRPVKEGDFIRVLAPILIASMAYELPHDHACAIDRRQLADADIDERGAISVTLRATLQSAATPFQRTRIGREGGVVGIAVASVATEIRDGIA